MRHIRTGRTRLAAVSALLALTATMAGCSSDSEGSEPIDGAETETPGPEETGDGEDGGEDADVAALEDLYAEYWDVVVELENGGELDVAVFEGIATGGVAEDVIGGLRSARDNNVHREGEPVIDNVTVSVDGDTAHIESCKSEADWTFVVNGEPAPEMLPEEAAQPHVHVLSATRESGEWLINGTLKVDKATITC
jgi:hypothetical protein